MAKSGSSVPTISAQTSHCWYPAETMDILPNGKWRVKNERNHELIGSQWKPTAGNIRAPLYWSLLRISVQLSVRSDRHSENVRKTRRVVKVTEEFPLPKFLLRDAAARNQQRATATKEGWSKLTPVRPLCAPDACMRGWRRRDENVRETHGGNWIGFKVWTGSESTTKPNVIQARFICSLFGDLRIVRPTERIYSRIWF